ncbi:MAG: polyprenyl synthetase family protein [Alistipes finegoldii]
MITLDTIRKPVTAELEAFDEFVDRQFTAEGELLSDMLRYALSSRGKGIRPLLVLLSAAMNSPVAEAAKGRRVHLAAMLVEMIHVASLIHDDVIDEADMRRGKPSANARWQSHKAVILGDYILARNLSIGLTSGQFDLVTHVCGSMAALCEGEVLQSECAEKHTMTRQAYLDIIYKKTACLIGVSASAGAMAVGASQQKVALMRRFGEAVGMAFQIQDDILDYTRTAHTGKPANNDLREGKITLPLLAVLDKAPAERRTEPAGAAGVLPRRRGVGGIPAAYGRERRRTDLRRRGDAQLYRAGRGDALGIRGVGLPYGAGEPLRLHRRTGPVNGKTH